MIAYLEDWPGHQPTSPSTCWASHNVSWSVPPCAPEMWQVIEWEGLKITIDYQLLFQLSAISLQNHFRLVIVDCEPLLEKIGLQFPEWRLVDHHTSVVSNSVGPNYLNNLNIRKVRNEVEVFNICIRSIFKTQTYSVNIFYWHFKLFVHYSNYIFK